MAYQNGGSAGLETSATQLTFLTLLLLVKTGFELWYVAQRMPQNPSYRDPVAIYYQEIS